MPSSEITGPIREFLRESNFFDPLGFDEDFWQIGVKLGTNELFPMRFMAFLQAEFGVKIGLEDMELDNFGTINLTAAWIERKRAER